MKRYPNLISESLLINETIDLLHSLGGSTTAVNVVDYVMKISEPEPFLAKMLVSDLVERDPRLAMNDDAVMLVHDHFETRSLPETEFVVFDLETTGAKAPPCRITEIGAYRVKAGTILDEFHTLVNPQTPIPPFIQSLTGITNEMVKNAPVFAEIAPDFLNFIGGSVLVAHNSPFDMRFLNFEIGRIHADYRLANPCLCTVLLSRKLLPQIENHKLKTVAEHYSISLVNHHRASDDAYATAQIFVNLLGILETEGRCDMRTIRSLGQRKVHYAR